MSKTLSPILKANLIQVASPEQPLFCLKIDHSYLAEPVYITNDTCDLISNLSNATVPPGKDVVFRSIPFQFKLPDEIQNQLPTAELSIDNVGKELTYWIEQSQGAKDCFVTIYVLLRSNPNNVEYEITSKFINISISSLSIDGTLSFEDVLNKTFMNVIYSQKNAPGLYVN